MYNWLGYLLMSLISLASAIFTHYRLKRWKTSRRFIVYMTFFILMAVYFAFMAIKLLFNF